MELISTLSDLVRINSVNPAYAQGQPEAGIQAYILDFFQRNGIAATEQEVLPGRPNVIGVLPGRNPGKRLLFEAHCDTAGIDEMTIPPFAPEIRDGRLYGRGACDTKAGLVGMLHAIADLKNSGTVPEAEIWVAATADEEHAYRGALRLREGLQADGAVVAEPTELRLVTASKGCVRWRAVVRGKAAHSSKPHLGVNAIFRMAHVLTALEADTESLREHSHRLVGSPTLNAGVIRGGSQVNIVPNSCTIEIDRRLIPGEDPGQVFEYYKRLLEKLGVEMERPYLQDWPLDTPTECQLVETASDVLRSHGLNGEPSGVAFGSDASKFSQVGIPSIIFGPGSIDQAHTVDEYVALDQVEPAFLVYRDLMRRYHV